MLKKTINYTDYNGVERKGDFYFNLSKAEIMEMQFSYANGLEAALQKIIDTKDQVKLAAMFKELILKAYGEKSDDGNRFVKVDRDGYLLANDFAQTEAYSILYMELATDEKAAAAFVNGIIPADLAKEIAKEQSKNPALPNA